MGDEDHIEPEIDHLREYSFYRDCPNPTWWTFPVNAQV